MKVKTMLIILGFMLMCSVVSASVEINSSTTFPYTMSVDGETYILTENISTTAGALIIGANNITFDGQNYIITHSTSTAGICIIGNTKTNIIIKNVTVTTTNIATSSTYGIYGNKLNNSVIHNCNSTGVGTNGIYLIGSENTTVTDSISYSNTSHGIRFENSNLIECDNVTGISISNTGLYVLNTQANLTDCLGSSSSGNGIQVSGTSTGCTVINSSGITNTGSYGLYIYQVTGNTFTNCTGNSTTQHGLGLRTTELNTLIGCNGNGGLNGIYLYTGANNTTLENCNGYTTSSATTRAAIWLEQNTGNILVNCNGSSTQTTGFYVTGCSLLNVTGGSFESNDYYGGYFDTAINGTYSGCSFISTTVDGLILLDYSDNNTFTSCAFESNTLKGIRLKSSTNNTFTECTVNSPISANGHSGSVLLITGDSISEGYPTISAGGWGEIIEASTELSVCNQANAGEQADQGLLEFEQNLDLFDPDIVTIMFGCNDMKNGRTQQDTIDDILAMAALADSRNIEVYIMLTPAVDPSLAYKDNIVYLDQNLSTQTLAAGYNIINFYDIVDETPYDNVYNAFNSTWYTDTAHMNADGNSRVAIRIARDILSTNGSVYVGVSQVAEPNGWVSANRIILQSETALPFSVTPSSDSVNITVSTWTTARKVWNESSESHSITTSHIIGGFPANTDIDIYRDGIDYATVTSNSTGYATWTYSGGFSEHEFEAIPHVTAGVRDSFVSSWENTVSMIGVIIVVSLAGSALMIFRGKKNISSLLEDLPGILLIVVLVVIGAIIFGSFN